MVVCCFANTMIVYTKYLIRKFCKTFQKVINATIINPNIVPKTNGVTVSFDTWPVLPGGD